MIQITLIGTLPPIKGVSDYLLNQLPSLEKKTKIVFYGFKKIYPEKLYPGGTTEKDPVFKIKKTKTPKHNEINWYNPLTWIKVGLKTKGSIVHFHYWTFYLSPIFITIILLSKIRGKKIVCTAHNISSHETGTIDKKITSLLFSLVDHFIVHSQNNKTELVQTFKKKPNTVSVVPHGNYSFYEDTKVNQHDSRRKLGIPLNKNVLLLFGNLREYKGYEELIKSFHASKKEIPELFLVIAGKPWNNQTEKKIRELIGSQNDFLFFPDYVPSSSIKYYFSAADLVVLPYREFSSQSGPGNIAIGFGKPLLVTNVGGLSDLVLDPRVIVEPNDSKKLSHAINRVFSTPGLLKKLSRDSIVLNKKYSWDSIADETVRVYFETLWGNKTESYSERD